MAIAETLLILCLPDAGQRTALLAQSRGNLSLWSPWLTPLLAGLIALDPARAMVLFGQVLHLLVIVLMTSLFMMIFTLRISVHG